MALSKKSGVNVSLIVTLLVLTFIGASALVLSGNFANVQNPLAPLFKPQASALKPKVTEGFSDAFKSGTINLDKWIVNKTGDASVVETPTDNLRITVPAGAQNNAAKGGNIVFKQVITDNGDFRAIAVLRRPLVTGDGTGVAGIRFNSTGDKNDEGAVVRWVITKTTNGTKTTTTSKASFFVTNYKGQVIESEQVDLPTPTTVFQLVRVNKTYRAYYKLGADVSADLDWKPLGTEQNGKLGQDGNLLFFAHNAGVNDKFPKVVAAFDQVSIGWEGKPATTMGFSDAFANGNVGTVWKPILSTGATVVENAKDNLQIVIPTGAVNGKPGRASLVRMNPTIAEDKNFAFNAAIFKPVVGTGIGAAGITFQSTGNQDAEAASIQWVVNGSQSHLLFSVHSPDPKNHTLLERATVDLNTFPAKPTRLTLRLARSGNKYTAWYRTGDADTDWVNIGQEENNVLGGDGKLAIFASNVGASSPKLYPRVIARFDGANGSVQK